MKLLSKPTILFLLILLPVASACRKEAELNLDITVVDDETGEPVVCYAEAHYEKTGSQDIGGNINLGDTDGEGRLRVRKVIGRNKHGLELHLYAGKFYTHCMPLSMGWQSNTSPLSKGRKVSKTIRLKPMYHYKVSIKNVNCFDETDTVWVSLNNEVLGQSYRYTGCADVTPILGGVPGISYTSTSSVASFHIKVKRNGQTTEYDEAKQLTKGIVSPIAINY
jgi:hypothetical protein